MMVNACSAILASALVSSVTTLAFTRRKANPGIDAVAAINEGCSRNLERATAREHSLSLDWMFATQARSRGALLKSMVSATLHYAV